MVRKRQTTFWLIITTTLSSVIFGVHVIHEEPDKLIRQGTLIFGDQKEIVSNEMEDGDAGTEGYQADQPYASEGFRLAERKLRRLRPSVSCDENSMTLRMTGRRVPRFLVERGQESPVSISEMPAHCGFSQKRTGGDTSIVSRYDACHVTQQGDRFTLPLRVWGAPVKVSCPVAATFSIVCSPSAMVIHLGASLDSVKLKVNGEWQPMLQASDSCGFTVEAKAPGWILTAPYQSDCWQTEGTERWLSVKYMNLDFMLSCPLLQAAGNTTSPVNFPYPYGPPRFWPFHYKSPTAAPEPANPTDTASTPKAGVDMWYPLPYDYLKPWSHYHGRIPLVPKVTTKAPETTVSTTTPGTTLSTVKATNPTTTPRPTLSTVKASLDQMFYPFPNWPYLPVPPKTTTAAPEATTTTLPPKTEVNMWYPLPYDYPNPETGSEGQYPFPFGHGRQWPLYYGQYPVPPKTPFAAPETTVTASPPEAEANMWYPLPYDYPNPEAGSEGQYPFPFGHGRRWPLYNGNYPVPPMTSTAAPQTTVTTTTPGPIASDASTPKAEVNMWYPLPYGYPNPQAGSEELYPFPYGHGRLWPLYYGQYPVPPKTPFAAPETTDPANAGADRLWHFYHRCLPAMNPIFAPKPGQNLLLDKPPTGDQQLDSFPWVPVVNQKPWMPYFHRRARRLARSVAGRLNRLCSWPLYYPAKVYNPPQQSSKDVRPYPFMANPVHDQAFVNRRWKSVMQPAPLSPFLVTAGTTNDESVFVSA